MAFPPKHIVVASDLSESSHSALETAAFFARTHGATLELLHVFDPSPYVPVALPASGSQLMAQAAKEMRDTAEKSLEELAQVALPGLDVKVVCVRREDAGAAIAEHAKAARADLVIVGSHGRTGLKRVLLGSVAERVVRLAPCPVLVVRPGD